MKSPLNQVYGYLKLVKPCITQSNFIEIRDLCFRYGDRIILNDVNIDIPRGQVTSIMGPSGSGKTTLLRLIAGQIKPQQGSISVDGRDISRLNRKELFVERRKMGVLFQSGALFTDLSVYENVAFPLRVHTTLSESMIRDIVFIKLEAVGLRGARKLMPAELSGGMARRVALARAIVLDPQLILYDEPFAGQDPISIGMLAELMQRLGQTLKLTSVMISHNVSKAAKIADNIYVIADGKVAGYGPTQAVLDSADPRIHQFIHGLADGPVPFHYPAPDYRQDLGFKTQAATC